MAHLAFGAIFVVWAALVATNDIRFRRISNPVILAGFAAAFCGAFFNVSPFGISLSQASLGALVGLIGLFPFFMLRLMGAADVKIFAVLGAWCGVRALLWLWVAASLAAGIHAVALLLLSRASTRTSRQQGGPTLGRYRATPYAACLTVPAAAWLAYVVATGSVR
ncbi:A24 family peptidase [Burkholderia dolosa]|uniref:A24 family peptidase n=1 Tax=Burkholderia dolosa TaxID=152500 RepID=UPI0015900060|nr:prepilin peptidase [Burkholderia dolosa]MBR8312075.1 prepilin peptidase [Burkholderia dolosa]MBR8457031.1 prepilin peptidase [Burkholderia dolosa]MBY4751942.1 prepilin peptidase [Burkholderia dolosa]MDN7419470.1 prepilin peptidase [Burkholderia dolosa]